MSPGTRNMEYTTEVSPLTPGVGGILFTLFNSIDSHSMLHSDIGTILLLICYLAFYVGQSIYFYIGKSIQSHEVYHYVY